MKRRVRIAACLCAAAIAALPVAAQDQGQDGNDAGRSLMERGAELFLEGLKREMEPALDDLRGMAEQFGPSMRSFIEEMGPALADLMSEVGDWSAYEPPEILPNGDIIIRRKPDLDPDPDDEARPEAEEKPAPSGPTDI